MIDLSNLNLTANAEVGYTLQLVHPVTGVEMEGMTVRILGDKAKSVVASDRTRLNELQQKERVLKGKNKDLTSIPHGEWERMAVEAATARVVGWTGISEKGVALDFTPENVEYVLGKFEWMRDQIREAASELTNFQ